MSLKRIMKECQEYRSTEDFILWQQDADGKTIECRDDGVWYTLLVPTTDPVLGHLALRIHHPSEYPFKPFQIFLSPQQCSNIERVKYKLKHVCPDWSDWGNLLRDILSGDSPFRTCYNPELNEFWSPALSVPRVLRKIQLGARFSGPSFYEAYPEILRAIPTVEHDGVAMILFGSNHESIPGNPDFALMMDPLYDFDRDEKALQITTTRNDSSKVVVELAAAWCFNDAESWQTMENLLCALTSKNYTQILAFAYGIRVKMPWNIPVRTCPGGTSITTPYSYGG